MTKEETIRRIKSWNLDSDDMEVLSVVITELHESEDERIINQLITLVNSTGEILPIPTNKEELIAWLNKCKESLHITETCKENADSFTDEDEMIRKALIEGVSQIRCKGDITREQMIAYLEKMGEQKYLYYDQGFIEGMRQSKSLANAEIIVSPPKMTNKVSVSEELYEHIRETCACIDDAMSSETLVDITDYLEMADKSAQAAFDMLEKQKPAEYLSKRKVYDIMNKLTELSTSDLIPIESEEYVKIHEITSDVCGLLDYPIEQKPAEWSEKDKDYYDAIIAKLEVTQDDAMLTDNQMDFLKSLPERLNLQPKREWSEEDEKQIRQIERIVKNAGCSKMLQEKIHNWLKSLHPQPKQEWSEDNIKELTNFEVAMLHIGMSFFGSSAGLNPNNTNEVKKQAKLLLELVPKQEWNKEDEKMIDTIVSVLGQYIDYKTVSGTGSGYATPRYSKEISWLNSLKNRGNFPKSNTNSPWSEEDEKNLGKLHRLLVICQGEMKFIPSDEYDKLDDWLKSLRPPQYCENCKLKRSVENWKPSEEQIGTLKQWLQDHELDGDSRYVYPIFYSLLTDLQNL